MNLHRFDATLYSMKAESDLAAVNPITHFGYLDGLRAVAALFVVIHHSLLQVTVETFAFGGIIGKIVQPFYYGQYGVSTFIVLSGYCLMLPVTRNRGLVKQGWLNFFKRRAIRILPPYYFSMALSLLLVYFLIGEKTGTHWDVSLPVTTKSFVTHLLLVPDVFGESFTLNHVFWSIAVEWRIYFLFPLLVLAWRKAGPFATTLAAIIASFLLYHFCIRTIGNGISSHYIGLFAMGMLGAGIAFPLSPRLALICRAPWGWITVAMTFAVVIATKMPLLGGFMLPDYLKHYVVGLWGTALLVYLAANQDGWLRKVLGWGPLVFVGTFAYSIYLIHAPLIQILWQYVFTPLQSNRLGMFLALSSVGTALIVGCSYLFFVACERPFMRAKIKDRPQPPAVEAVLEPAP